MGLEHIQLDWPPSSITSIHGIVPYMECLKRYWPDIGQLDWPFQRSTVSAVCVCDSFCRACYLWPEMDGTESQQVQLRCVDWTSNLPNWFSSSLSRSSCTEVKKMLVEGWNGIPWYPQPFSYLQFKRCLGVGAYGGPSILGGSIWFRAGGWSGLSRPRTLNGVARSPGTRSAAERTEIGGRRDSSDLESHCVRRWRVCCDCMWPISFGGLIILTNGGVKRPVRVNMLCQGTVIS